MVVEPFARPERALLDKRDVRLREVQARVLARKVGAHDESVCRRLRYDGRVGGGKGDHQREDNAGEKGSGHGVPPECSCFIFVTLLLCYFVTYFLLL
jgi:hypothetical protein